MSGPRGLGSRHIRGEGQPRPPPLTWRERLNEYESCCAYLAIAILALPLTGIAVVAYFVGIEYLAGVVVQAVWRSPVVLVLLGLALITIAALGSVRIYRRRHLPEVTPLAVILWVGFALFLIAMGVGSVAAAFSDRTDAPGF